MIALLVQTAGVNAQLASAVKAVGDIMVGDYYGNKPTDAFWFKAVFLECAATRAAAINVLMQDLKMLRSPQGNDFIKWDAEMSTSNRPSSSIQCVL